MKKKIMILTSLNPTGEIALKKHIKDSMKMSLRNKLVMRASGIKQEVVTQDPYTIAVTISGTVLLQTPLYIESAKEIIKKALKENGATFIEDYSLEVREE